MVIRRVGIVSQSSRTEPDQVARVAEAVSIPVIGMGGIETGADAVAFIDAGARAVAVGTATFRDPLTASRVRAELAAALEMRGKSSGLGGPVAPAPSTST